MKKGVLFILFFILIYSNAFSTDQKLLDSLRFRLTKNITIHEQLSCLYTLSFEYSLIDPIIGIKYGKKCLALAKEYKSLSFQLNAYNGMANAYETLTDFDSALIFHTYSYTIALQLKDENKIALTRSNMALCYKELGNYETSLEYQLDVLRFIEKQKVYNPRIHYYIAELYLELNDLANSKEQARIGYLKSIEFNHPYIAENMQVITARCLHLQGISDSALYVLKKSLGLLRSNTDQVSLVNCLKALGEICFELKRFKEAALYFSEELVLQEQLQSESGICLSYINLANSLLYLDGRSRAQIIDLLRKAERDLPNIRHHKGKLSEIYLRLATLAEKINEHQKSALYFKNYAVLRDSLMLRERSHVIAELQTKYETEKKEHEIEGLRKNEAIQSLELKNKNQEISFRNLIIYAVVGVLLLSIFLAYTFIQKQRLQYKLQREQSIQQAEEKERIRIAKDIHDDLGSGLSKINFLADLTNKENEVNSEVKKKLALISETSQNLVTNMRDLVWALGTDKVMLSDLFADIRAFSSDYLEEFSIEGNQVVPSHHTDTAITKEAYRNIMMMVKESLNNIVKHSNATFVTLEIELSNSLLKINVKDNGKGIQSQKGDGNGLKNLQERIHFLKGNFEINSEIGEGTELKFAIPITSIFMSNTTLVV